MSSRGGRQTTKDLVEEAKKRVVLLLICVVGLSYLMSLTSSSVWVNLPAAAALIIFGRYISHSLDVRRRTSAQDKLSLVDQSTRTKSIELHTFPLEKPNWRRKVNSPTVEAAIDQFTKHLISEWVTDLWYSRITPDKDGPEELVQILNTALGEISNRARDINIINLLTRDIINLVCNHLELYRLCHSKLKKQDLRKLSSDSQDAQLRLVLAADNKLHPALFSAEAEHKVLQHLMNGLIQLAFRPEDLQCSFFRYAIRELLACAVFRPVLNLANPRVINEKIENLVLSFANKSEKRVVPSAEESSIMKPPTMPSADQTTAGVELVQVRLVSSNTASDGRIMKDSNGVGCRKELAYSSNAITNTSCNSGGEWAQVLDVISRRKTRVLAPENLESMWTKGRYYKQKEGAIHAAKQVTHGSPVGSSDTSTPSTEPSKCLVQDRNADLVSPKTSSAPYCNGDRYVDDNLQVHTDYSSSTHHPVASSQDRTEDMSHDGIKTDTESSYHTEDDENNNVTGLDSPGTRVWDSKNKRNAAVSQIHHPLETSDLHLTKKNSKKHVPHPRTTRTSSGRKRPRSRNLKDPIWQEIERTSFVLGERQDILHETKHNLNTEALSDGHEAEILGRLNSGETASSSLSSISTSESCISFLRSSENSVLADSFLKLRCEVIGANIVKSGSGTFAVYCIAVTDTNNNSWSIKRRYTEKKAEDFNDKGIVILRSYISVSKNFMSTILVYHLNIFYRPGWMCLLSKKDVNYLTYI